MIMKHNNFLVQINGMELKTLTNIFNVFKKLDIKYETFKTISKSNTITDIDNNLNHNLITIGGVSFLRMLNQLPQSLKSSVDYDINLFDQNHYKTMDLPLLNNDAQYFSFNEIKDFVFENDMFVKPSKDIKSFNGGTIFVNETLNNYIYRTGGSLSKVENEQILIAPLKKIFYEYRFFIHNDEILGASRYSWNYNYSEDPFVPDYIMDTAKEYAKLYNPTDIFVMDLAETDKGIFIVEYQCWNISAFYSSNLFNLIGRINEIKGTIQS